MARQEDTYVLSMNQQAASVSDRMVAVEAIEALIARHVDPNPSGQGPGSARLRDSGVSVWLVIACMDPFGENLEDLADDYDLPEAEVMAALYFYWRHREAIDARIAQSRATFVA